MRTHDVDPYYYARDHDRGPGAWCIRGPNGFQIDAPDKSVAYIIGKLLSGRYADAKSLLDSITSVSLPRT
jgi:hypothetical protein